MTNASLRGRQERAETAHGAACNVVGSIALAERLRDRFSLAGALWSIELVSHLLDDCQAAREFNERSLKMSPLDPRPLMERVLSRRDILRA